MADLTRPDFGEAWASEGEKLSPDSVKIKLGWVREMMPYQFENFLQSRQDEAILYLLQKGVPEYSSTQEYTANKSVVVYQGNLYMATATVAGVLPTVTASWKRISPTVGANGAVAISSGGTGATSIAGARTNLGLGTASTANLPSTNGVIVRSADNTLISRLLTGTSGNISITNPDGVAGNININVGANVAQLDKDSSWTSKGGITLPKGSSGERGVEVPGKIRYNTELQKFEGYNGTSWNALGATSEVEITTLSGDGITTSFTLNTPAFSESSTDVYIGGVYQNKGTYSVSGTTLTFSEAPTPGTDNIQVVSRRVVDLGIARASQVSIEDATNKYTATTVEGALREITEYEGGIEAEASWDDVPKHKSDVFNAQAQALTNRTEMLNYGIGDYDKIRSYSGSGTRLKVQDPTGVHWWVRRGSATDNGGTVLVDALGRSWEREYAGVIMVCWFQTVGNGIADDTTSLQAAINYAAASGEELRGDPGAVYRVTSGLTANGALRFNMCGSTIDGSAIPIGTGYNQMVVLKIAGTIDAGIGVTANVTESATSISVANTTGLSAEDYVFLSSQQTMVDGYGNSANKRGELGRIKTVTSGTTVELVDATLFGYESSSPTIIQKINPLFGVSLKNGSIIAGGTNSRHTALQLFYCVNPVIEDMNITGGDDVGVATFFCYGGRIKGGRIRDSMWQEPGDPETAGGTGYGVCLYSATRDFVVEGVHFENCIRAITGGGAYPSVHCLTKFCVAEDVKNGFGGHEPCWWWTVEDCVVRRASGVGVNCRGQFMKVHRCKFFDTSGFGIQVRTFYTNPLGVRGTELVDNEFVRSGGILLDGDATNGRVVDTTIRGGRFEFTSFNNIAIRRSDKVLIDGVQFVSQRVVTANDGQAVSISGSATSGDQCTDIVIANCQVVNAARRGVSATRVQRLTITGINVMYALNDGIYLDQCVDTNISGNSVRGGDVAFSAPIRAVNSLKTTVTGNNVTGKNDPALTSNHGIVFSASGGLDCLDNVAVGNTVSGAASAVIAVSGGGGTINHTVVVGNNGRNCYGATKFNIVSANQSVANNLA